MGSTKTDARTDYDSAVLPDEQQMFDAVGSDKGANAV